MRQQFQLEFVAFDTQAAPEAQGHLRFFHPEQGGAAASAAQITEPDLVRWLARKRATRELIFRTLSLSESARCQVQVKHPFLEHSRLPPGDIDLLASDLERPHLAVAIEWKRVKVRVVGEGDEQVNKIDAMGDAGPQVRGLQRIGFDRTYLGVVVAVDGRAVKDRNFLYRGASDRTFRRTVDFASGLELPQPVGLVYVEIAQPLGKSIDHAAVVSAAVIKPAERRGQSDRLTAHVENYLRKNSLKDA